MKRRTKQKLLRGSKGAVSVFLIIVLVPMMTISCLFVDMSRVRLAKSVVHSAGDLAMNTVLTQYDTMLEQYYGLFATSQSLDSTISDMREYFERCIVSAGISEKDAQMYVSSMWGSTDDTPIMDMLNIAIAEGDNGFNMAKRSGASLCNPILLKGQIVNFMKYRAPINTGLSLLASLKSFANLDKETECIDKRSEYYKQEQAVNSLCSDTWIQLNEYNKLRCSREYMFGNLDSTARTYFRTMQLALFDNNSVNGLEAKAREKVDYEKWDTAGAEKAYTSYYENGKIKKFNFPARYKEVVRQTYANVFYSTDQNLSEILSYTPVAKQAQRNATTYRGSNIPEGKWYYAEPTSAYSGSTLKKPGNHDIFQEYKEELKQKDTEIKRSETRQYFPYFDPATSDITTIEAALIEMKDNGRITTASQKLVNNKKEYKSYTLPKDMDDYLEAIAKENGFNYPRTNSQKDENTRETTKKDLFDLLTTTQGAKGSLLMNPYRKVKEDTIKNYEVILTVPTAAELQEAYNTFIEKSDGLAKAQQAMKTFFEQADGANILDIIKRSYLTGEVTDVGTIMKALEDKGYNHIRFTQNFLNEGNTLTGALKNYLNACQWLEYVYRNIPTEAYKGTLLTTYKDKVEDGANITLKIQDASGATANTLSLSGGAIQGYNLGDGANTKVQDMFAGKPYGFASSESDFYLSWRELEVLKVMCKKASGDSSQIETMMSGELEELSEQMKEFQDQMTKASGYLGKASEKLGEIYNSLTDANGGLNTAKKEWETSVNNLDKSSSVAAQDKADLENIGKQFKPEEIQKFKVRIDKIKAYTDTILTELKSYKIGTYPLADVDCYSQGRTSGKNPHGLGNFRNALNGAATNGTGNNSRNPNNDGRIRNDVLNSFASDIYKDLWTYKQNASAFKIEGEPDSYPYLKQNVDQFYTYLYNKYGNKDTGNATADDMSDAKDDDKSEKEIKSEIESNKKKAKDDRKSKQSKIKEAGSDGKDLTNPKKDSGAYVTGNDLPSKKPEKLGAQSFSEKSSMEVNVSDEEIKEDDDGNSNAANKASGLANTLFSGIKEIGTGLRDSIYISEYVMDMFSYHEEPFKKIGNTSTKMLPNNKDGDCYQIFKSLTMQNIEASKNLAYGSEIEYILFGKDSEAKNIAAAYASIYGVRLCFNLVYAFTDGELRAQTLAIATPLSALTMGIIPAPLIQAGLLIVLALAESGLDLVALKNGEKVNLYKTKETWRCSVSGAVRELKDMAGEEGKKLVNKGVDALTDTLNSTVDEIAEKTQGGIEDLQNELETALDQAYEKVVREQVDAAVTEITSAIMTYKELEKYGDQGLESMSDFVGKKIDEWGRSVNIPGSDAVVGKARTLVVAQIKTKSNEIIGPVSQKLDELAQQGIDKVQATADSIKDEILICVKNIEDKIEETVKNQLEPQIKEAQNAVKQSINKGGEELKNTLNSQLDKLCANRGENSTPTTGGVANLFAFDYRDYLRLFLTINCIAGQDTVLMRTADLIQCNMRKVSDNGHYELSKSACYMQLQAKVYVKPMFLAIPLIADCARMDERGSLMYEISYNENKGY